MLELILESSKNADKRVCFSTSDKMTQKGLSFNVAFEKSIKSLRKGIDENRKELIKIQALEICKEDCKMWDIEFKL